MSRGPEGHDNAAFRAYAAQGRQRQYLEAIAEPEGLWSLALGQIEGATHFIEYAFNLRNLPECPYTFPDDVRGRAAELLMEIFLLWKNNKQRMQLRTGGLVDKDQAFQRFMASAAPAKSEPIRKSRRKRREGGIE